MQSNEGLERERERWVHVEACGPESRAQNHYGGGEGGEGVAEEGYVPQSAESAPWPSGRACGKGIANLQASWMWGWGWGWESVKGE